MIFLNKIIFKSSYYLLIKNYNISIMNEINVKK